MHDPTPNITQVMSIAEFPGEGNTPTVKLCLHATVKPGDNVDALARALMARTERLCLEHALHQETVQATNKEITSVEDALKRNAEAIHLAEETVKTLRDKNNVLGNRLAALLLLKSGNANATVNIPIHGPLAPGTVTEGGSIDDARCL